jgi:radical SAM superfamily enzyme YgiQ (UPF0313 family)
MARYLLSSYLLKTYVKSHFNGNDNLSIDILNFSPKTEMSKICSKIIESNPNYIGYSCYVWNIEKILKVIKELKNKSKSIIHILGGPEISFDRILSLPRSSLADYYVIGEGETKLLHLMCYLEAKSQNLDAELPKGLAYWEDNVLKYSGDTENITKQAFMETQRGCKFKCKYCVYHKGLPSISYYSLERIFAELKHLIVEKQIKALRIFDAVFTSDIQRAKKIAKYLLELKNRKEVRLPWIYWELTCHNVDEEFVELTASLKYRERINNNEEILPHSRPQLYSDMLRDYTVINCIGIQSSCKQALKTMGRPAINIEKFDAFMNMVRKYNIVLKVDLILGLPFETFDSYLKGIGFFLPYFKDSDHILNIHRLQILPGSELEGLCAQYGIKYSDEAPHVVLSTRSFSEYDLNYASKLTAVLFRLLNSPLRRDFLRPRSVREKVFTDS